MYPSKRIEAFIKSYEQCRLRAYMPTKNDVPTIGWGHTEGVKMGTNWTQAVADAAFTTDLAVRATRLEHRLGGAPTTQAQFDALLSLVYNIGDANFAKSSVLTNHIHGHYQTAASAFALWNKQCNKATGQLEVLNGLTTRRAAEADIYRGAK